VPSFQESVQQVLDDALHGKETSNYELTFETKSKEIRYLLVNATTRRDAEGNVVGVVGGQYHFVLANKRTLFVFDLFRPSRESSSLAHNLLDFLLYCSLKKVAQDLTDDRKHTMELQQMQSMRASQEAKIETEKNMSAYFAHELRNPLHSIVNALSVMPKDLDEQVQDLVESMEICTQFMSSIMNNLLDVRKMEEGKMELSLHPTSLESLMMIVHRMLAPSVPPGVSFHYKCNLGDGKWAVTDSHRLQQIWTNMVTNAIKYTPQFGGSITLTLEWEGDMLVFKCIDTGMGIPKSQQKDIFKKFVQRGGAPGTGLGLAIAKHLVEIGKGSIKFDSDPSIKVGTTCIVKMPFAKCAPVKDQAEIIVLQPIQEPVNILIIDDISMNRKMLKKLLLKWITPNAKISEAICGEEALVICQKEKFDIIVVDYYMEEGGGVLHGSDVAREMREMGIQSIIIGCSGNDMQDEFCEAGCDLFWGKPLPSNNELISQLQSNLLKTRQCAPRVAPNTPSSKDSFQRRIFPVKTPSSKRQKLLPVGGESSSLTSAIQLGLGCL
jgi:signal transduction histidine kinase/CheY-like chemotaxis protein